MAPVEGIRRTVAAPVGAGIRRNAPPNSDGAAAVNASRALIAVEPIVPGAGAPMSSRRPAASFLAHLIATAQQAPQTRQRRRVDPDIAIMSYRAAAADPVVPAGRRLARSC